MSSLKLVDGCFIKDCSNNELVLGHKLQLPNTVSCSNGDSASKNNYCYNGECRSFDCSGYSETNESCNHKTGKI